MSITCYKPFSLSNFRLSSRAIFVCFFAVVLSVYASPGEAAPNSQACNNPNPPTNCNTPPGGGGNQGLSPNVVAAVRNTAFAVSIDSACSTTTDTAFLTACSNAGLGNGVPVGATFEFNLGLAGASSSSSGSGKGKGRSASGGSKSSDSGDGAGSDDGSWGLLVAPQYGKSDRINSGLESGYRSELRGIALGLDYAFSDDFIAGAVLGTSRDEITFDGNAGSVESDSHTLTLYGTWVLDERHSMDAYLGFADAKFNNERVYFIGSSAVAGTAIGSSDSNQTLAGIGYNRNFQLRNAWTVGASVNLDYIETDIDAYTETGGSGFDLSFPDQNTESLTSTLGLQFSYPKGNIIPNIHVAAVHEYKADARQIDVSLALSPGTVFSVETDIPDRGYLVAGIGLVGILNNGSQWFVDYEERYEHDFLDSWALSAGFLTTF